MNLPVAPEEKLQTLTAQLLALRQNWERHNQISRQFAVKRDELHKQTKGLLLEIAREREQRDALNRRVKELKAQRDSARAQTRPVAEEIRKLNQRLARLRARKPKVRQQVLKREKEKIEWKVQTTPLSLEDEKPLVKRANQLERQLNVLDKINELEAEVGQLACRINTKRREASLLHGQLLELARLSQELHRRMVSHEEKKNALQAEADRYHNRFVETRLAAQKIDEDFIKVRGLIETLRKDLVEGEERKRKLQQEEILSRLKAKASEKLKKGEKLTFAEFKLLTEDG